MSREDMIYCTMRYREAADKKKILHILADEMMTTPETIAQALGIPSNKRKEKPQAEAAI